WTTSIRSNGSSAGAPWRTPHRAGLLVAIPTVGGLTMPTPRQPSLPRHAKTPQPAGADSPPPTPTDMGELVAAAQTVGGEALDRLLAEARPKMFTLAMRVLNNADEAEDAVQDAMIKVWKNLGRFEGRAAFTTWLHRIAVNAALDRMRRRGSVS